MDRPSLRMKARPGDFIVEEVLRLQPGARGDYAVYRATKRLMTTLELQEHVARVLDVPPRAVVLPALKDRDAIAIQHLSVRGRGPSHLTGEGFSADFLGRMDRHLAPGDLAGNRFTVALEDVEPEQASVIATRMQEIGEHGLPNYFDQQRFGSYTPGGTFIGKAILLGDAEAAVKAYLAEPASGDPPPMRAFKRFAADHWGDWDVIFKEAPRSNHRSVITFLKDHPADFRKAINLITPRLLPVLLAAYQSFLWNRIASRYLEERLAGDAGAAMGSMKIAGEPLVMYRTLGGSSRAELQGTSVPRPQHHALYTDERMGRIAGEVLAGEGLQLERMKARLLKRAFLPRGSRPLIVVPKETRAAVDAAQEAPGRIKMFFFLPPGSYATLVIKAAVAGAG